MTSRTRFARRVALGAAATVLTVYPLSALVLAGPKTPITFELYPVVASYMHPYFPQNWNLFAPDPISEERGAIARFRCTETGEPTEWVNITQRGIDKVHASRLFPSRESRIVSNSIITRFREDDVILRVDKRQTASAAAPKDQGTNAPTDGATDALLEPLREASQQEKDDIERVLARYASARQPSVCAGGPASQVQLRFVFHKFPGWSSRNDLDKTGDIETFDTEWITP
ncbi:DUF5819 family protein [Knoellia subterranea]|uniref:Uncharacterized protein n=1 Tax=Knoellia subterranea KCTC 19937 TaxID=1385521 RepID=A0A0A0JLG4_9MICO|nr:DUF5819 family protein [Knoellia subterranea]KGN37579.1 hypothetical protein N803_13805 [Knoellia subterranea KCTC 19937]